MQQAYTAIGRAVFFAQLFETALIPIFEGFKMQTEPGYLLKTGGYIPAGAFKVPITNIIKVLSAAGNIAPDLEERLTRYAESRHTLVHRWVRDNGWPAEDDVAGFVPIIQLANQVETEAKELTRSFTGYMLNFSSPDRAVEYKAAMTQLFHRAHVERE